VQVSEPAPNPSGQTAGSAETFGTFLSLTRTGDYGAALFRCDALSVTDYGLCGSLTLPLKIKS